MGLQAMEQTSRHVLVLLDDGSGVSLQIDCHGLVDVHTWSHSADKPRVLQQSTNRDDMAGVAAKQVERLLSDAPRVGTCRECRHARLCSGMVAGMCAACRALTSAKERV